MDTTGIPEDGAFQPDDGGAALPKRTGGRGPDHGGVQGWVSSGAPGDDVDYAAGYGYGPGYGNPGDSGYGEGYGAAAAPRDDRAVTPMPGGLAVSAPQPPVVGPTPALRGLPGGPGIRQEAEGSGAANPTEPRKPAGRSPWQRSQSAWSDSGIAWQRPVVNWEPAEAEWERIQAGRTPQGRLRDRVRGSRRDRVWGSRRDRVRDNRHGGTEGSRRDSGGSIKSSGQLERLGINGRLVAAGAALVTVVAVLAGVGFIVGRDEPAPEPSRPRSAYPAARLADADFATTPSLNARGVSQALDAVASYGSMVVAAGSKTSAGLRRTQFFVSADGGRTWQLAPVTAPDGGEQLTSQAPTAIAAGPAGWLALAPGMSWTSTTGRSWRVGPPPGLTPMRPGDRLLTLTATASGFLAAGSAARRGGGGPVIWVSPDGLKWRRTDASQLHLSAPGTVHGIIFAAAHGDNTVIAGQVSRTVVTGTGKRRRTHHITEVDLWPGFVLVRPAVGGKAGPGCVVYTSTTGRSWSYGGKITAGKQAHLRPLAVSGSDQGAVIAAVVAGGRLVAYQSASGRSWRRARVLGRAATASLSGLTVIVGGNVVAAGAAGGHGLLVVAGVGRVVVDLTKIRGASFPERAVNAIASTPGLNIAVGSANGNPAVWIAPRGHDWSRASGANPGVFSRAYVAGLSSVTYGRDGWLAVGGTLDGATAHPVVVFSRDGLTWHAADGGRPFASANGQGSDAGKGDLDGQDGPRSMSAVTAGPFGYVAVGQHAGGPAVWTSPDGRIWRLLDLPAVGGGARAGLEYVAASGSRVVALGDIRTAGRTAPLAALSADGGQTWREVGVSLPGGAGEITGLTTAGTGFVAVSTIGSPGRFDVAVLTSPDGTSWKPAVPSGTGLSGPGIQEITALTTDGGRLLGAGFNATGTTQDLTLWLAPPAPARTAAGAANR